MGESFERRGYGGLRVGGSIEVECRGGSEGPLIVECTG